MYGSHLPAGTYNGAAIGRHHCKTYVDFTYFETFVDVPAGSQLEEFTVNFSRVDDGARVYVFNSDYPEGTYAEKADIAYKGKPVSADISELIKIGDNNRIVIAQFDNCWSENVLRGANVVVNGVKVPATQVLEIGK